MSAHSKQVPAVRIVEVGPRDGLQNVKATVPTSTKIELINRLRAAGLQTIELTSVVSPKAIPQLADCEQVLSDTSVQAFIPQSHLRLPVLVPNRRGLDVALRHGVKEVAVFISATEGFSQANIKCSVAEGLVRASSVAAQAKASGCAVRGYVSCIFADPYDGPTAPSAVLRCVVKLLEMGCYEVSLGDTLGVGSASEVKKLITYLVQNNVPVDKLAGHFHDTYGQAVTNVWQAFNCGIRVFDSSVGGLGGCPFAPGAKGNVATEDLVYMFQQAGVTTGVDLLKLAHIGAWISQQLSKANDSRAGSALVVKQQRKQLSTPPLPTVTPTLEWSLVESAEGLLIYRAGPDVKLVLDRPKNANALTTTMISRLVGFFDAAKLDPSITRIVITANGRFFCTGMDLGKGSTPIAAGQASSDAQYERLFKLFEAIDKAPQITIAGINGPAFGGGIGLAFACDVRLAVSSAAMTLSEVKLGITPATISKYVLREWGPAFAREAMLSARRVPISELKTLGVIAQVANDSKHLQTLLDTYLVQLRNCAPHASSLCKELVRLDYMDGGGEEQARGIKAIFEKMMLPDAEGAYGVKRFQAGDKTVDWDAFNAKKLGSKL